MTNESSQQKRTCSKEKGRREMQIEGKWSHRRAKHGISALPTFEKLRDRQPKKVSEGELIGINAENGREERMKAS